MTRPSFRPIPSRVRRDQLLLTSALALVLTALPVGIDADAPVLHGKAAFAGNGDGGGGGGPGGDGGPGGGGGGPGGGAGLGASHANDAGARGRSERGADGRSFGHQTAQERAGGRGQGYHDLNELVDSVRNGRALGLERRDERIEQARERYAAALEKTGPRGPLAAANGAVGPIAHRFSPEETRALIERGWQRAAPRSGSFRNHGERVRTMVELSKRLGYGAHVGALQANFGTPQENRIAALQAELAAAEAAGDEAAVERLEAELAEAIANAKPGDGPDDSWATADLDVNEDGVVDGRDLEALEQSAAGLDADGSPAS